MIYVTTDQPFGKLHIKVSQWVSPGSHKKIEWVCDCGKTCLIPICSVLSKNTKSCGRCNYKSAEYWINYKSGKLRMLHPKDEYAGTRRKTEWLCDCGNITLASCLNVTTGITTSCGKCEMLSADHFKNTKYGKLIMEHPAQYMPGSHTIEIWLCDCGNKTKCAVYCVVSHNTGSCGRCNMLSADHFRNTKYGRLKMKYPVDIHAGSNKEMEWLCDCGGEVITDVYSVTKGKVKSCGKCRLKATNWYENNKEEIRNLKTPIKPNQIPSGYLTILEDVITTGKPFKAICGVCGDEYYPVWDNIKQGKSLTCGCGSNQTSSAQINIANYIESIGIKTKLEHTINGLNYDIFVPSHNLLVEYNGLKWHSFQKSKARDITKYKNAIKSKHDYLMIFEDEWLYNKKKVEALLQNKFGLIKSQTIRPSKCEIKIITSQEADIFYKQFHYIGKCSPKISYGVFYNSELIACISFSHPTRQSKHLWELVRMASDPKFRIHGIWSKLVKKFIKENNPTSIVSFSDNRLFSGGVYEKIGFKFDGNIPSDYYWVKGQKRHHKSTLRKKGAERTSGLTETQLRTAQGYKKIWDLGKKRWVFDIP